MKNTECFTVGDKDIERKTQAEVLLNAWNRELERRRLAAGAQGAVFSNDGKFLLIRLHIVLFLMSHCYCYADEHELYDDDSDDESFHYPGSSTEPTRSPSIRSTTTDYLGRSSSSRGRTDLTLHLSQAPEFRVPTHEAPQKVLTPRWTPPTPHQVHAQWERDEAVSECRECKRRFNFITRRVRVLISNSSLDADIYCVACKLFGSGGN